MTTKNSDGQIPLDLATTDCVPEWLRPKSEFDPALAERFKREAMACAASSPAHQELLRLLRPALVSIALSRSPDRSVTADDAQVWLGEHGYPPAALGNAAGSLFRGGQWELVGYRQSERVSRHRNRVGVWRLKDTAQAR
jgi:hypothetical protein